MGRSSPPFLAGGTRLKENHLHEWHSPSTSPVLAVHNVRPFRPTECLTTAHVCRRRFQGTSPLTTVTATAGGPNSRQKLSKNPSLRGNSYRQGSFKLMTIMPIFRTLIEFWSHKPFFYRKFTKSTLIVGRLYDSKLTLAIHYTCVVSKRPLFGNENKKKCVSITATGLFSCWSGADRRRRASPAFLASPPPIFTTPSFQISSVSRLEPNGQNAAADELVKPVTRRSLSGSRGNSTRLGCNLNLSRLQLCNLFKVALIKFDA